MTENAVSQVCLCLSGKQKAYSEDPSSKLSLVSCGLDPCHEVMPKCKKSLKKMFGRALGHSA